MTENTLTESYSLETVPLPDTAVQSEDNDDMEKWHGEQQMLIDEARGIKRFHTIDSDVLFEKQLEKRRYIVDGLLPEGLTVLSGDPKVGKSFFALSLSVSVAKGEPFLCFPTKKSDVLYFSFEDDEKRLQQRLFEMSDDTFSGLTFSHDVLHLDEGFIETLEDYLQKHPDAKLVVVDTLNYIRPEKQSTNMYKNDYDDMIQLHRLTLQYGISMLLLHHNRKVSDEDDLRSISGSMGIAGGADTCIVIKRPKSRDKTAKMKVISRDIESFEMEIVQGENGVWITAEDKKLAEKEISVTVRAVYLFYTLMHFSDEPLKISPTDLSEGINELFSITIPSNMIKKNLTADHEDLEALGLKFEYERNKKEGRRLVFHEIESYRKPKYYFFDEKGKFVFDAFFSSEYENDDGDSGDRVTAETDIENDPSAPVTRSSYSVETEEEKVSGGDSSDVPVTADSHCESSCQPVTRETEDVSEETVPDEIEQLDSDDDYDEEDEFTHEQDDEKELEQFFLSISDALVKQYASRGITIHPFNPHGNDEHDDEKAVMESEENVCRDMSETVSGDSTDAPVTADSRCETSCQPVTRSQNGSNGGPGLKQNSAKKKKKKSRKKLKKKR